MSTERERLAAVLCAIASDRDHARQDPIWAAEAADLRAAAALLRASSAEQGEESKPVSAPKEVWVVVDVEGTAWESWHKEEHAQRDAMDMDAEKPRWAPHTVHRYVLAAPVSPSRPTGGA